MSIRIRNMLQDKFNPQREFPLSSEQALDLVCELYARPRSMVLSHDNTQVKIKLMAAMLALTYTGEPMHMISMTFERRDEKSLYRWMRRLVKLIKDREFADEWAYVQSQIGKPAPKPITGPQPARRLIKPPRVLPPDHPLTPERRACHMMTVAYARALHRAHGEAKRWE